MIVECHKDNSCFNNSNDTNHGTIGASAYNQKEGYGVADVFRSYAKEYRLTNHLPKQVHIVIGSQGLSVLLMTQ